MQTGLLLQKIQFYKNLLIGFYFLTIVAIISSLSISGVYFYKTEDIKWELILSVLGILIFGVILPYILIQNIKKKILLLKIQVEEQVQSWVREWFKTYSEHGSESFQKSEFWLKIALITLEQVAQYSTHPGIYSAAEISKVVRIELDKQNSRKAS